MWTTEIQSEAALPAYAVEYRSRKREAFGEGTPAFTLSVTDEAQLQRILAGSVYAVALAFIRGEFDVQGDLVAALRLKQNYSHRSFSDYFWTIAARFAPLRLETWLQSRKRAASNIRFHYDISNDFYATFLDSRLIYSDAYFEDTGWPLERAQQAKLECICKDLDLHSGEHFLDVGCGWGGLLVYAAERFGVCATGCTLSRRQREFADAAIARRGLDSHAMVLEMDYRDLAPRFDKIASIGMFEHVGRHRLGKYFRKIYSLLEPGGLFLNSGIMRPESVYDDPQTWFLLKKVFPGGELAHLSDVVREAERAGFHILDIHTLRSHYARTCREWVARLRQKKDMCLTLVGEQAYRTWLLYLAASALSFENCRTGVFSLLMTRV